MAVLNPPEFMPQVMRMLTEAVADGDTDREALLDLAAPEAVGGERSAIVRNSMAAVETVGLVVERGGELAVSDDVRKAFDRDGSLRANWPTLLLEHILAAPEAATAVTANLAGDANAFDGVRDLIYAATWFLSQDARHGYTWTSEEGTRNVERLHVEQVGAHRGSLRNDTRWDALQRWLIPLELAVAMPGARGVQPNPSGPVGRVLREEAAARDESAVPVRDLCDAIGRRAPILWPGEARVALAAGLGADPDPDVQAGGIDSSIGVALEHLEHLGRVVLENRADASQRLLLAASTGTAKPVTHVVIGQGGAA